MYPNASFYNPSYSVHPATEETAPFVLRLFIMESYDGDDNAQAF